MTPIRYRKVLDLKGADAVMDAAERAALGDRRRVVIAVVDPWGRLLHLRRTEDAQAASDQVAIDKARTAAIFVRSTREIEAQVTGGRLGALALHGAAALTGGIPLVADGEIVGAVGASGETPDQDEAVSLAGAGATFSTRGVPALSQEGARLAAEAAGAAATARSVCPGFWGRPSVYQLWADLQDLFRRIKPDFDPTVPEVRSDWEAENLARA